MHTRNLLIIGLGAIGLPVANALAQRNLSVTGLARGSRNAYALDDRAHFIQADARTLRAEQLKGFTGIAIIVTPDEYSTDGYQSSYLAINQHLATFAEALPLLDRLVFISSTGVYGQDRGEWIDEHTDPTMPKRESSKVILQAEQTLQQSFKDKTSIIRPSGIYGRKRLMRLHKAQEAQKDKMPAEHWSNRIMDQDLVTIVTNVMTIDTFKSLYIATDYLPVTTFELTTWLSQQIHTTLPQADDKSAFVTGKRLHSNIPLAWLDYPDWQEGYRDILQHQHLLLKK